MAVCPHCRQETDGTLPFCQFCGQRLAVENEPTAPSLPSWLTRASQGPQSAEAAVPAIKPQLVARLTVVTPTVTGQSAGREFPLDGREVRIGRAPSCEINLDGDPLVSRFHAVLRSHDGAYSITDLGSSNGTLVNDQEIHAETPLREGDELTIGECRLSITNSYFEIDTAHVPQSQPLAQPQSTEPLAQDFDGFDSLSSNGHSSFSDPFAMPPASAGEFGAMTAAPELEPEAPAAPPPPKDPEPEELRDQMASVSARLTQQAREAIIVADHYRNALEDARQRVTGALSQQPSAESVVYKGDLNGLSDLVRQVVENPQHLELVTRLASRAQEVAAALDTLNATAPYANLLGALADLRQRVEEALKQ